MAKRTASLSALASIHRAAQAGVATAKVYVEREREMFEMTNHSCYSEGWAAGYMAAMKTMQEFIDATIKEAREDARRNRAV